MPSLGRTFRTFSWRGARRLTLMFVALPAIVMIAIALLSLVRPYAPLRIERYWIGTTPATIYYGGGRAPAIVIAHGFAGSQQLMEPFALTLARAGYTALTFDFPGHGRNAPPNGMAMSTDRRSDQLERTIDAMVAAARERGDGRVGLLGHSMGAGAVTRYAMTHDDVEATVALSSFVNDIGAHRPRNLLLIAGAFEGRLVALAQAAIDRAAGGAGARGVTYGSFADGTARRLVVAPYVEHIGVLYSATSLRESLAWFDQAFGTRREAPPLLDRRMIPLGSLFAGATLLFWTLTRLPVQTAMGGRHVRSSWSWWGVVIAPALLTPVAIRAIPTHDLLPILVGGPLAVFFAVYGGCTALGVALLRPDADPAARSQRWWTAMVVALVTLGYIVALFGLPAHRFMINLALPSARVPVFAVVLLALLPYLLADEYLTRRMGPRGAYAITKAALLLALALAIALDAQLFFLTLILPLFVIYFALFGLFSGWLYRLTGTPLPGALINAIIFAWSIAAVFPLVA